LDKSAPEQISGWLKTQYPDDESMRVSHETIYRSLFIQARGVLKQELMEHLRSKRRMRRSLHATVSGQSRGQIVDALSLSNRRCLTHITIMIHRDICTRASRVRARPAGFNICNFQQVRAAAVRA
jgi:IS30 family transposase